MEQLNLFGTIACDHCGNNPGPKPKSTLWNGFLDQDTGQHVCWSCKKKHYKIKQSSEHGFTFSEVPVMMNRKIVR